MSAARLDFAATARGRWPAILSALGIDGACLLDRHGPCLGCGGRDRFRFDDRDGRGTWLCSAGGGNPLAGDGFDLLQHAHGWQPGEYLRRVTEVLGLAEGRALPPVEPRQPVQATPDPAAVKRVRDQLNRLWASAVTLDHDDAEPGRRYLTARGLGTLVARGDWPFDVRLHPACPYWITGTKGRPQCIAELPALLALVRAPVGLHTT